MSSSYSKVKIIENIEISKNIYKVVVERKDNIIAGQFYMLRSWGEEPYLSRPISVHSFSEETIEFLYEVRGRGTEYFSELKTGDTMEILGPLGNGFDMDKIKGKVAIVTGGIGIAPMYQVMKDLKDSKIDFFAGFREESYCVEYMSKFAENTIIATESGKEGYKGYVIDKLDPSKYDYILTCGPTPMMNVLKKICEEKDIPLYVSMESNMACGIGACLGCTCNTVRGKERICKEGPVFLSKEVTLDA